MPEEILQSLPERTTMSPLSCIYFTRTVSLLELFEGLRFSNPARSLWVEAEPSEYQQVWFSSSS